MTGAGEIIPVVLVTGYLGAGKTTLINDLLAHPSFGNTAVVVNEFGDIAIDHDLMRVGPQSVVITSTGCLCCVGSSDVRASLFELWEAMQQGIARPFSRVIVETTGLADPTPVVNALIPGAAPAFGLRDHVVARRFRLAGVVTCIDVVTAKASLEHAFEAIKQAAFADLLVLTKTDLTQERGSRHRLQALKKRLAAMNPAASIVDRPDLEASIPTLFEGTYIPSDHGEVVGWLALDQMLKGQPASPEKPRPAAHGGDIRALPLIHDGPVSRAALDTFLTLLAGAAGSHLLRLKGLVSLADDPDHPVVVHAVQHLMHPAVQLAAWPNDDRRTRLVVIGRGLNDRAVAQVFAVLVNPKGSGARLDWRTPVLVTLGAFALLLAGFALRGTGTEFAAATGTPALFSGDSR